MTLVVLGCSLSADGHAKSWSQRLEQQTGLARINLAVAAGSNTLQIKRFQHYLLTNSVTDSDIIIWQITATSRSYAEAKVSATNLHETVNFPVIDNVIDGSKRLLYTASWGPQFHDPKINEEDHLQELLFHILMARRITAKVLVIFGWDTVMSSENLRKIKQLFEQFNIDYIDESILTHSLVRKLPLELNDTHPSEIGYVSFADNQVLPKLQARKFI